MAVCAQPQDKVDEMMKTCDLKFKVSAALPEKERILFLLSVNVKFVHMISYIIWDALLNTKIR